MTLKGDRQDGRARIKVIGAGGGGGNAVNRMISAALKGVEFIAVNTDMQALDACNADVKVNIGRKVTRGLGSGADWTKGRDSADESRAELTELCKDTDMVFITAGMGGGTGTGSAPVIAEVAKQQGALTIAVVTRPFRWEGKVRNETADEGIKQLRDKVDALIVIPNDRLTQFVDRKTTLEEAFRIADDVLRQGVQGIADLIVSPGTINLDFADVKAVMQDTGEALMGIGFGSGDNRAEDAAKQAVSSPLLETSIDGAQGILFNITAGRDITLHECEKAAEIGVSRPQRQHHLRRGQRRPHAGRGQDHGDRGRLREPYAEAGDGAVHRLRARLCGAPGRDRGREAAPVRDRRGGPQHPRLLTQPSVGISNALPVLRPSRSQGRGLP